jgi:hypothetical protein
VDTSERSVSVPLLGRKRRPVAAPDGQQPPKKKKRGFGLGESRNGDQRDRARISPNARQDGRGGLANGSLGHGG